MSEIDKLRHEIKTAVALQETATSRADALQKALTDRKQANSELRKKIETLLEQVEQKTQAQGYAENRAAATVADRGEVLGRLEQKIVAYKELGVIATDRRRALEAQRTEIAGLEQRNEKQVEQANAYDAEVLRLHGVAASQYKCMEVRAAEARRWEARANFLIDGIREKVNAHVARAAQLRAVQLDLDGCEEALIRLEALAGVHQNVARDLTAMMAAAEKAWAESAIKRAAEQTERCVECGRALLEGGQVDSGLCGECIHVEKQGGGK